MQTQAFEAKRESTLPSASSTLPRVARTVGIDLALTGPHVVVIVDERFSQLGKTFKADGSQQGMQELWERSRKGLAPDAQVMWLMEPTGHAWLRMTAFLRARGEKHIYVPSMRKFSVLRKTLSLGVKNDRLDALALARLPAVAGSELKPYIPQGDTLSALRRIMKMDERLQRDTVRAKNRLHALMGLFHPGVLELLTDDSFRPLARKFIRAVESPEDVETPAQLVATLGDESGLNEETVAAVAARCRQNADFVRDMRTAGNIPISLSIAAFESRALLDELESVEARRKALWPRRDALMKELDPDLLLRSLPGIGPQYAAVIMAYSGPIERFRSIRDYKGYIGLVPGSQQSGGNKAARGTHITKAGPGPLKQAYFHAATLAVRLDVQLAEFACRLQERGLRYSQVMVAVANKLMARVHSLLRQNRLSRETQPDSRAPIQYEQRTVEGASISGIVARELIQKGYRMRTVNNPKPKRERMLEPTPSSAQQQGEDNTGLAGADRPNELETAEKNETPPAMITRQSQTPQQGAVPKDSFKSILEASACPENLKRLILSELADIETDEGLDNLGAYLRNQSPLNPDLIQAQWRMLKRRAGRRRS